MTLSAHQTQVLLNACQATQGNQTSPFFLDIDPNVCGCWRWATSGLTLEVVHDPAEAFTHIATGFDIIPGSGWADDRYTTSFQAAHQCYDQYVGNGYAAIDGKTYDTWFNAGQDQGRLK
jgi:hypothetical protein